MVLWQGMLRGEYQLVNNNSGTNSGVIASEINGSVNINVGNHIRKLPSIMPKFIEILAELVDEDEDHTIFKYKKNIYDIYDIDGKIRYNNLFKYRDIVDDYGEYYYVCNTALDNVNQAYKSGKKKILRDISEMYKYEKRTLLVGCDDIENIQEAIRENSDSIIDNIKEELIKKIRISYNEENFLEEDLNYCASIFVCYCFVECKILEKPPIEYERNSV